MIIFPAIDIYENKVVRLYKGNYDEMTTYSDDPVSVAKAFKGMGATHLHVVDLEGAKKGTTSSIDTISKIAYETGLFIEIGGGIRTMDAVKRYKDADVSRVIIGTAAVKDEPFLLSALDRYGELVAVGADIKDGQIAIKGWIEVVPITLDDFMTRMQSFGIRNVVCTDISKDGTLQGANASLYKELSEKYTLDITASGGVSSIEDIRVLRSFDLYGAIIGKAYYSGAVSIEEAIEVAK